MTRALWFLFTALFVSACTTSPVREDALAAQPTAAQTPPPPCQSPEHLVRDLTVPWPTRTYVIGPCPKAEARVVGTRPAAPASSDFELSASGRPACGAVAAGRATP